MMRDFRNRCKAIVADPAGWDHVQLIDGIDALFKECTHGK